MVYVPTAAGARVSLVQAREAIPGTLNPAPTWKAIRTTTRNINPARSTLTSAEVRQSRQVSDMRLGFQSVAGTVGGQLGLQDFDDQLEAILSGTWAAVTTGNTTLSATATGYARTAGSFLADGFEPGDVFTATGFTTAANNGQKKILSVTALTLDIADADTVVEAAGAARALTLQGMKLLVGQTKRFFTMERRFPDITRFQPFYGCVYNTGQLTIQPGAIATISSDILGISGGDFQSSSIVGANAIAAASSNEPFDSFDATLYEDGVKVGTVTNLTINMTNNRSTNPVVGDRTTPDVFEGDFVLTGQMTAYLTDGEQVSKFLAEEELALECALLSRNGTDFHRYRMGRVKYTGGSMDPPQRGPITLTLPFQALEEPITQSTISVQRSNVS